MPLSVAQVLTPDTETKALNFLLDALASLGFNTTSWQNGSVQRNTLTAVARQYAGGTDVIRQIVEGTLTDPKGTWLDLVGTYRFGISRLEAVAALRTGTFVNAASAPPHSLTEGSYIATEKGVRFLVQGGPYAIAPGGTEAAVPVIAEVKGTIGNVSEATAVSPQTPVYSGLACSFDGAPTTTGVDLEIDDRYWQRCLLRWAAMTYSVGLFAYEFWALTAAASVTRVKALNNYPTPNEVRVVLEPGIASEITAVENYVSTRHPPNDDVGVSAASVVGQLIEASPRIASAVSIAAMELAVQAMLDAMPIGGVLIAGASAGRLLREQVTSVLTCSLGATSAGLVTPAADIVLGGTDIITATFDITPEVLY